MLNFEGVYTSIKSPDESLLNCRKLAGTAQDPADKFTLDPQLPHATGPELQCGWMVCLEKLN